MTTPTGSGPGSAGSYGAGSPGYGQGAAPVGSGATRVPAAAGTAGAGASGAAGVQPPGSGQRSTGGQRSAQTGAGGARKPSRGANPAAKRTKPVRPPRLASLQLRRIDPWTALKVSLIVSIVMFFVWMIAVGVLYLSLDALSVWDRINETYNTLIVSGDSVEMRPDLITPGTVFGVTAVVGAINIVLFTALSAIAAFVYNAAAGMAGGVELTLGERD